MFDLPANARVCFFVLPFLHFSTLCIVTSKFTEYIHISQGPCRNPIGNIDSAFREIPFDFDAHLTEQYGSEENSVWDIVQILVKNHRFQSNQMDQNFVVVVVFSAIEIQDAML